MNAPLPLAAKLDEFRKLTAAQQLRALRGLRVERSLAFERAGFDEEERTGWLSIASEQPYERWWGIEILDHSKASIRAGRLETGAPLLVGHNTDDQVGVVERYEITSAKKLRILARFSRSARAEEIWQDVLDGIRRNTSVGYIIHDLVLEKSEDGMNTYRVTDWEPLEGSIVSVPADTSVGVGRNLERNHEMDQDEIENSAGPSRGQRRREERDRNSEFDRVESLTRAGNEFANMGGVEIARELIRDPRGNLETFKARVLAGMRSNSTPALQTGLDVQHPPYGAGARASIPHGRLEVFKDPERAHAFGRFLRAQVPGFEADARWCRDRGMEVRYLTGTTNPAGGYLVPAELSADIISNVDSYGVFRREARVWPMGSDALNVPVRTGGIESAFMTDDTEANSSDPTFGSVGLYPKELGAQTRITRSLLEDSVVDLGDYVARELAEAFGLKEDQCGFLGDGTSTYGGMQGLIPKLEAATAGQSTATGHDLITEIDATDVANLVAKLPQYAHGGAKFYMSMSYWGSSILRLLMGAGGNTVKTLESGAAKNPEFAGFPVVLTPLLPSNPAADMTGEIMMLFGDLRRSSAFGDRRTISILVDPFTYAGKSQIRIVGTERFVIVNHHVGDTVNAGPVVALVGGT